MKYQAYPAYKDSGVEWLGVVPEHWEVKRLRFVANYKNSNVDKKSYEGQKQIRLCNYTDVYKNEFITNCMDFMIATATESEIKSMSLTHGDVIITKDSEDSSDIGIPAIVSEKLDNVICGYHLTVISSQEVDTNRFIHRIIQSHATKFYFYIMSPGITRFGLNQDTIGNIQIVLPSLLEQTAIANFLDRETSRIDELSKEKERFIELLKEKRQALISHAVTKGLNPTVKMKNSGIAWLGEIPEHWDIIRLRFIAHINTSKSEINTLDKNIDVQFLPMELVNEDGTYQLSEIRKLSEVYTGYTYCRNDDVILAKITPCFENGKGALLNGLVNGIAFGSTEFHVLRANKSYPKFIFYITKITPFKKLGEMEMKGAVGQQRIPDSFIRNFYIAKPPFNEQTQISNYLDQQTAKIDALITETQNSINLLKEHRAALISAAVTGKIDVRE